MWQKTLIGTLAMALAAGAVAQDKKDEAAARAEQEARSAEEAARREIEAVQKKLDAEAANLDKAAAERNLSQKQFSTEKAKLLDRQKQLADDQRLDILTKQKQVEVEGARAMEKAQAARRTYEAKMRERFVARQPVMKREKVAFIGVGTSEPPAVLVEQLKLTPRLGLVADFVEPGSPAEQSGIKQHDVLLKFDDQKLVNAEQLRSLVRLKKPGDDVKVSLIRQGQPMELVLELGEKEVEEPVEIGFNDVFVPEGNVIRLDAGFDLLTPTVTVQPGGEAVALTNVNGRDQAVWTDGKHKLAMELINGKAVKLSVSEQGGGDGKPLFEGPVENEKQREAVPAEFREKLKRAEAALPQPGVGGPIMAPQPMRATAARRVTVRAGNDALILDAGGNMGIAPPALKGAGGPRVVTSTDKDNLMLARIDGGKVVHVLAFSQADGKTLFEGPVATPEERKALPEAVAKQLEVLEKNQNIAPEFGVVGRN
jgi:membrane-associated protease RseP (regulator of RpoE activity)